VILYNLLSAYKRVGLPEEFHTARPKRLRFLLFNTVGKVVRHARQTLLHCTKEIARALAGAPRTLVSLNRPALAGVLGVLRPLDADRSPIMREFIDWVIVRGADERSVLGSGPPLVR
jgi:hypothetical protein